MLNKVNTSSAAAVVLRGGFTDHTVDIWIYPVAQSGHIQQYVVSLLISLGVKAPWTDGVFSKANTVRHPYEQFRVWTVRGLSLPEDSNREPFSSMAPINYGPAIIQTLPVYGSAFGPDLSTASGLDEFLLVSASPWRGWNNGPNTLFTRLGSTSSSRLCACVWVWLLGWWQGWVGTPL